MSAQGRAQTALTTPPPNAVFAFKWLEKNSVVAAHATPLRLRLRWAPWSRRTQVLELG